MVNEMTKDPVFKRIDLIAALTSGFLLFASCAGKTTKIERQPWFLNAREYVEGYEMGCKLEKTDEARTVSSMEQIHGATKNYLDSKPPTEREVLAVLDSKDDSRSKVALGAMVLRPLARYKVISRIISFLNHRSTLHRDLASMALTKIDNTELRDHQDLANMIFDVVKNGTDPIVTARGLESLGKFDNPKYLPIILEYLKKTDNHLYYYSAFRALKAMDPRYFQEVRVQLEKEGDSKTLNAIDQTENFWEMRQKAFSPGG